MLLGDYLSITGYEHNILMTISSDSVEIWFFFQLLRGWKKHKDFIVEHKLFEKR